MGGDKRFIDNGDGTVTDSEANLMWKQTDAFQDTSKWFSWFAALDYVRELNNSRFAGYTNWRMPTMEEAEELYDPDHCIRDVDRMEIFIDSAFSPGGGFTTWCSDERPNGAAIVFYYRYGHANVNYKELDVTKDTVRAVRDVQK